MTETGWPTARCYSTPGMIQSGPGQDCNNGRGRDNTRKLMTSAIKYRKEGQINWPALQCLRQVSYLWNLKE